MDEESPDLQELSDQLEAKADHTDELQQQTQYATAHRLAMEVRREARAHRLLVPLIRANFDILNFSQNTMEVEAGIEAGLENIALLGSPEKAAAFGAEFPEAAYERQRWMLVPCYHMYASRVGLLKGMNSEGMQRCIADGQSVVRRNGSKFTTSFQEFASDVFLAADDPQMALHHARVAARTLLPDGSDRRWAGAKHELTILLGYGQFAAALDTCPRVLELARSWHTPLESMLETISLTETTLLLLDRAELLPQLVPDAQEWLSRASPEGEDVDRDLHQALARAVRLVCGGDRGPAIDLLTHWDQWLSSRKVLTLWFEVRCRLIAAMLLDGQPARAERLATPLRAKAKQARDFRTIRRIRKLFDPAHAVSAIAPAEPVVAAPADCGEPVAAIDPADAASPTGAEAAQPETPGTVPAPTPLQSMLRRLAEVVVRAEAFPDDAHRELLSLSPANTRDPKDAAAALSLMGVLADGPIDPTSVSTWARAIADPHPSHGQALSAFAALVQTLAAREPSVAAEFGVDRIEATFRSAMDLEPDAAAVFARAGRFFLAQRNPDEAERCLARASRLDRGDRQVAATLANLYAHVGRPADGLALLDLCIREGGPSADLCGQAAVAAVALAQWTAALTYLDGLESLASHQPWTGYYRAVALLALGRYAECIGAIDDERERGECPPLAVASLRAAAFAGLADVAGARGELEQALSSPLRDVPNLSVSGIAAALRRAWPGVSAMPADDELRRRFERRCLAAGVAPDEYFDALRQAGPRQRGVNHYICTLRQPLDERWRDHEGCLPGEADQPAYRLQYGVLAANEAEATERVLAVQRQCFPIEPEIEATELDQRDLHDSPGVTWQGPRVSAEH